MRVFVVLPAYNEADNIKMIFEQFQHIAADTYNLDLQIILVDDGSTDQTVGIARASAAAIPLTIIRHEHNQGLAKTFLTGMGAAAEQARAEDIIICMDADNSQIPGQTLHMLRRMQEGSDLVIASRYRHGAFIKGVPLLRRFLSRAMSLLFRILFPIRGVRDFSCGYRAYRAGVLQRVLRRYDQLSSDEGFACMVRILLKLAREDVIITEIPIILRYDRKRGASKMKIMRTIFQTLRILFLERFAASPQSRLLV